MGRVWIRECPKCGQPYAFQSGGGGPIQDYEEWWCPHCKEEIGRERTGGVPRTRKLTPEEEREWLQRKKAT
jgi:hypothetical protein